MPTLRQRFLKWAILQFPRAYVAVHVVILLFLFALLLGLIFATPAPASIPIRQIIIQEMDADETTVQERGEIVFVADDADAASAILHVGDGSRSRGRVVTDPRGLRSASQRILRPDEYVIVPSGLAAWNDGQWRLLPTRTTTFLDPTRIGSIEIVTSEPLAGIHFPAIEQSVRITIDPLTYYHAPTSAVIRAVEGGGVPSVGGSFQVTASVTNVVVYAWDATHLIGRTNDLRHTTILYRTPPRGVGLPPDEPVTGLSLDRHMTGRYAQSWASYPALQSVRLDRQDLRFGPRLRQITHMGGYQLRYRSPSHDRVILDAALSADGTTTETAAYEILTAEFDADPITIWISPSSAITNAPAIQHRSSMLTGAWTTVSTSTDWPTEHRIEVDCEHYQSYRLQTARLPGFFRVIASADLTTPVVDHIEYRVADLRNISTVTAGQGFRTAVPAGSTNFASGITADIPASATLHVTGGIITGYTP